MEFERDTTVFIAIVSVLPASGFFVYDLASWIFGVEPYAGFNLHFAIATAALFVFPTLRILGVIKVKQ